MEERDLVQLRTSECWSLKECVVFLLEHTLKDKAYIIYKGCRIKGKNINSIEDALMIWNEYEKNLYSAKAIRKRRKKILEESHGKEPLDNYSIYTDINPRFDKRSLKGRTI